MSRTRTFVRNALLSGASIFVSMAALLIVGKLVTNLLPAAIVGFFALLLLWSDLVNIVSSLGLTVSAPKLIAAAPAPQRLRLAKVLLRGQALALLLCTCVVLMMYWQPVLQLWIPYTYESAAFSEYLWMLPLLFVPGAVRDLCTAILAGLNRYLTRSTGIVVSSVVQVIAVAGVAAFGLHSLQNFVLATAAGYLCAAVWLLLALRPLRQVAHPPAHPGDADASASETALQQYGAAVRFSWPLYANSLLSFVYQRLDTVLVTAVIGFGAAGIFDMAKRIPMLLSRALGALLIPYLPGIAEFVALGDRDRARLLMHQALLLTAAFGYGISFAVIAVQDWLLPLLFTGEYLAAAPALGLLLIAACLSVQAGIMGQTLIALNKPKWITSVNLFTALLSLALNALLLPRLGLMGAGIAALIALGTSTGLQAWRVHREGIPVLLNRYLTLQSITLAGLALVIFGVDQVAIRLLVMVLYPALLLLTRVVTWHELRQVGSALLPARKSGAPS